MASIDYGNILSRAWKTTFKYKWLWVYGIVLASLGGMGSSGSSGGGSSSGGSKSIPNLKDIPNTITPDAGKKLTQVLGASTSIVKDWASHVPLEIWILLSIVIILLVLYGLFIRILIHSWATGALIGGLKDAEKGLEVGLDNTTSYGKKSWKEIFLLSLISTCVILALIGIFMLLILLGVLVAAILHLPILSAIWLIGLFIIFIPLFIVLIPIVTMISIYGERLIVLQGLEAKEAFKKAFFLSKSNVLTTLLMGIIKGFLTTALGCLSTIIFLIVVGIPAVIVGVIEFKDGMHFPSPTSIIIWVVLFFLFLYATILVRGILTVFSYSTWNLFFSEITKEKQIT